jgi:hypothetical protein
VDLRAGLDDLGKRKFLTQPGLENKNRGCSVAQTNVFIYLFRICFGPGRPSSDDS